MHTFILIATIYSASGAPVSTHVLNAGLTQGQCLSDTGSDFSGFVSIDGTKYFVKTGEKIIISCTKDLEH